MSFWGKLTTPSGHYSTEINTRLMTPFDIDRGGLYGARKNNIWDHVDISQWKLQPEVDVDGALRYVIKNLAGSKVSHVLFPVTGVTKLYVRQAENLGLTVVVPFVKEELPDDAEV